MVSGGMPLLLARSNGLPGVSDISTNVTAVITEHHEEPQVGGKAVIYFYPSGRAERAMVWVGEQDEVDGEAQFVPQVTLELEALGRVSRSGEVLDWKDFLKEQK